MQRLAVMSPAENETSPLLQDGSHRQDQQDEVIQFGEHDEQDPKQWPLRWKYIQVAFVFMIGLICPLTSSIQAPAADEIQQTFRTSKQSIIAAQTGFVCMLGIGPLFLAPMSETFGRRPVFLINFVVFTLLQVPTALAPNVGTFIALRTLSGLFGSVGVANGGGTISDMFASDERATVFGFYLLGPLLGPSIGPLLGGIVVSRLSWRWAFWIVFMLASAVAIGSYFFLHETNTIIILSERKAEMEKDDPKTKYKVEGASDKPIFSKIASNSHRAARILVTQPIVSTMSLYQAVIFSSMFTYYTLSDDLWSSPPYNFTQFQVALTYLGPAFGFIITASFLVTQIDKLYKRLVEKNDGKGVPEYRLPYANIGAVCLPVSLFWLGWTLEYGLNWPIPLTSTMLFGAAQVSIFNTVQNYYIDSFEKHAASALAAGAFMRSVLGGIVPLFIPQVFEKLGYGWGMSIFGFLSVLLMPAPLLFYYYGETMRSKFAKEL